MRRPVFISGIGTGVGKTIVAAIVAKALKANYWKPVQAGFSDGTDTQTVEQLTEGKVIVHPEMYKLSMPASPHLAAKPEGVKITVAGIIKQFQKISTDDLIVVEGAGGLCVPLNDEETVADLIKALNAKVIIVSRNYLGSINHSLLSAAFCKQNNLDVAGWIFNDQFMNYQQDIVNMSGIKSLGSIPNGAVNSSFVSTQVTKLRAALEEIL
jgi:dethiobiotin synthetase